MQWRSSGDNMTGEQFTAWCEEMKSSGRATSVTAIAFALGISVTSVNNLKNRGCDKRTAYACAAIIEGIAPYGETK